MRHIMKTSFILAFILLGAVFTQDTTTQQPTAPAPTSQPSTPATTSQPSAPAPSGQPSGPPPSGQPSGPPPSGQGQGSGKPPQNLPPQEPALTEKLAAITDSRLSVIKNILKYLAPIEQDLIAGIVFFIYFLSSIF